MRKINHAFKRGFDVSASVAGLLIFSPLLTLFALLIWFQDFKSPFYISNRVGKNDNDNDVVQDEIETKMEKRSFLDDLKILSKNRTYILLIASWTFGLTSLGT